MRTERGQTSPDAPHAAAAEPLPRRFQPRRRGARRARRVPFALLLGTLVVGGLCLLLALNTASAANELRRQELTNQDNGIALQVQQLRNEVAASAAPGSLASAAAAIGMVPATNPAFLVIGPDGTVRVMGSPAPVVYVPPAPTIAPASGPSTKATASPSTKATAKASTASSASKHPGTATSSTASGKTSPSHPAASGHPPASSPTPSSTPTDPLPGGPR